MKSLISGPASQGNPQADDVDKTSQSSETELVKNDLEFTSKLPAITDLINLKTKYCTQP